MASYSGPYNIVITEAARNQATAVFRVLDPDSAGDQTCSVALSASGSLPATHWGARGMVETEVRDAIQSMTAAQLKTYLDQIAVARGRTTSPSVTAFRNNVQFGGGTFANFIAGLGLQRIPEAE